MSFTMEMNTLIQRYLKEAKSQELSLTEIDQRPHYKKVWNWWLAKAYYKMDGYYQKIEDVPEGTESYVIMIDKVMTQYFMESGKREVQTMDKATCKSIYGG